MTSTEVLVLVTFTLLLLICVLPPYTQGLTAYHDIALDKCYVVELNTTVVMPPRNLWELLINVQVKCSSSKSVSFSESQVLS